VVGSKNWQVKYLCKFISASFFVVVRQQQPGRCVVGEMHLKTLSGTLGNCRRLGQRSDLIEVRLPTRSTDRQTDKPTVRVAGETLFNNCFLFLFFSFISFFFCGLAGFELSISLLRLLSLLGNSEAPEAPLSAANK